MEAAAVNPMAVRDSSTEYTGMINWYSPITSAPSDYVRNFTQQKDLFDAALDRIFSGTATAEEAIMEVTPQIEALMQGAYSFGF